jgi:hypothetical protein
MSRLALAVVVCVLGVPALVRGAGETFESIEKGAASVSVLKRVLLPFVASCDKEKDHFRKLFCSALNERLKAQHQSRTYRSTFEPSEAGPLIARFKAKPKPTLELQVLGCLTCQGPLLEREGGDISKGRFFLFKMPKDIKIKRGKNPYDLGDVGIASYHFDLPADMTEKKFRDEVLPFLRLDLVYRPVAGVTMVGAKRFKYGVVQFELVGHRVYDHCGGKVYGVAPAMKGGIALDKHDMTCPQNQPRKFVAQPKLPTNLPKAEVSVLMQQVSTDLHSCYEQFGEQGDTPVDVVVSPDGKVKSVKVAGKLSGTGTAQCVERLIRDTAFPKFRGEDARLQWPLAVRN